MSEQQTTATGHVVGATYLSAYWAERYTVLEVASVYTPDDGVRVRWENGEVTVHCTPLGRDEAIQTSDEQVTS